MLGNALDGADSVQGAKEFFLVMTDQVPDGHTKTIALMKLGGASRRGSQTKMMYSRAKPTRKYPREDYEGVLTPLSENGLCSLAVWHAPDTALDGQRPSIYKLS